MFVESGLEEAWSEQGAAQRKSAIRSQRLDQGRDIEPSAPNISSGVVVPLPSDKMVPSRSTVPEKTRAMLTLDAFGLGLTQG